MNGTLLASPSAQQDQTDGSLMKSGVLNQLTPGRRTSRGVSGVTREARLTKTERNIVTLVGLGWRNAKIARSLYISDMALRNHLTSIFRKLSLLSRVAAATRVFRFGLKAFPSRAGRRLKTLSGSGRLAMGNRAAR